MSNHVHVVPHENGWAVKIGGQPGAYSVHRTQADATKAGTSLARTLSAELNIHGTDGKIREKNSYGNDPFPPRDKR